MINFTPDMRIGEQIETPSQTILKDTFAPVTVTDANGRTIEGREAETLRAFRHQAHDGRGGGE